MTSRRFAMTSIAVIVACAGVVPASAARQDHQVARAAALQQRLHSLYGAVSIAESRLAASASTARTAVSHYADAMGRLTAVQAQAAARTEALARANSAVAHQQHAVESAARAAYMSGGSLTPLASVLTTGDPTSMLDGISLLDSMAQTQSDVLARYAEAQQRQVAATTAAQQATDEVQAITVGADVARRAAVVAMVNRHMQLGRLTAQAVALTRQIVRAMPSPAADDATAKAPDDPVATMQSARRGVLAAAWSAVRDVAADTPRATARQGRQAVAWATKQLGVPYSWGGGDADGPTVGVRMPHGRTVAMHTVGFDCSGLVIYAWAQAGVTFDHYTGYQWFEGRQVALDRMRPGDLVFFAHDVGDPLTIHHVGLYVGDGRMIDAPHTGAVVRYDSVDQPGLIGAVRP